MPVARTIIAERSLSEPYWTAWFAESPEEGFGGPGEVPTMAIERLLRAHGLEVDDIEAADGSCDEVQQRSLKK